MFNELEARAFTARQTVDKFTFPAYGELSLSELAPTLLNANNIHAERAVFPFADTLRTGNGKTLTIVIDGLGLNHFAEFHEDFPFFDKLAKRGRVHPGTAGFPTTTPSSITTIHTGKSPAEHGLVEWWMYLPQIQQRIETLPFRLEEGMLATEAGGRSQDLYRGRTLYQELAENGIPSFAFTDASYAKSIYNTNINRGAKIVPFKNGNDAMVRLADAINSTEEPANYYFYWGHIDTEAHNNGPGSQEHIDAFREFSDLWDRILSPRLKRTSLEGTNMLVTADHGHVPIKSEEIINLAEMDIVSSAYRRNDMGERIFATGSPHDVFLFLEDGRVDEVQQYLQEVLLGRAEVLPSSEVVDMGLFGPNPGKRIRERVGDLTILPYPGYHVWHVSEDFPFTFKGIHGGLSQEEMIIPFAVAPLTEMVRR